MHKLLDLLKANKGRGAPLAMERKGNDVTIEVYDAIVTNDSDVEWYGGGCSAQSFGRNLRSLSADDRLSIRVNSPGGDVFGGVAMAQAMRECAASITLHIDGYAASAASFLVAAASDSVIAPGGMVMIHKAWTLGFGNSDDFMRTAALLEKIDTEIAGGYMARAGGDVEDWLALMALETWFTGEEAVAAGLVSRVAERPAAAAQTIFDMSVYANAPPVVAAVEPEPQPEQEAPGVADIERRRRLARAFAPRAA
ncbi:peptidase [Polymorphobacter multimanifer]|uniref:ATP-dependent Clp protease proteolytic subunit n=1 Tax=Polymorphobacter multimanifer TaxID=1070431 RepID=A0A841L6W5_9SPHN|nr:head maturation protease, ClpP-related [Polymorphobacter multimanifer]MBB6228347.1 ATP-dependent Clp protease protease subunit [Polymorphobacter multimanifer]GGI82202.1 peptidase [Polymorphobacter multimanifer]